MKRDRREPPEARSHRFSAGIDASGGGFTLRELVGSAEGSTVAILAGVHGDEPEGVLAARTLFDRLTSRPLRGTVLIVPVCNEAALTASSRVDPRDGGDLARSFPGDERGSSTERLAAGLQAAVIERSDVLVDLHSAGLHYAMPLLAGYLDDDSRPARVSEQLALAFGAPVVWRHAGPPPRGRTISAAIELGKPAIYVESAGGGRARPSDVARYVSGVLRVLRALGTISGTAGPGCRAPLRLEGSGDLDAATVRAPVTGLATLDVALLERVRAGQSIGEIRDPIGDERISIFAPADGVVVLRRRTQSVANGQALCHVANLADANCSKTTAR